MILKKSPLYFLLLPSFLLTSLLGRLQAFPMFEEGGEARTGENASRNSSFENPRARDASSSISHIGNTTSFDQVPSPSVDAEQAAQDLEHNNQTAEQAVNHFIQVSKTMVLLKTFNFIDISEEATALWSNNRGNSSARIFLLLNNGEVPNRLTIPASGGQARSTSVLPMIIPAGVNTVLDGVTTTAPTRVPDAAENREVRRLIKEAFALYYGDENGNLPTALLEANPPLDALSESDDPVTVEAISNVWCVISNLNQTDSENRNRVVGHFQIPALLAKALAESPVLSTTDFFYGENMTRLYEKAHQDLTLLRKPLVAQHGMLLTL